MHLTTVSYDANNGDGDGGDGDQCAADGDEHNIIHSNIMHHSTHRSHYLWSPVLRGLSWRWALLEGHEVSGRVPGKRQR